MSSIMKIDWILRKIFDFFFNILALGREVPRMCVFVNHIHIFILLYTCIINWFKHICIKAIGIQDRSLCYNLLANNKLMIIIPVKI